MQMDSAMLGAVQPGSEFDDLNFSPYHDSCLKRTLSQAGLVDLVSQLREGPDPGAATELAEAMYFTLRPAAFEAIQRAHGPFAISYEEWFYLKFRQFLRILLLDRVEVKNLSDGRRRWTSLPIPDNCEITGIYCSQHCQLNELATSVDAGGVHAYPWVRLVERVCYSPDNRIQALTEWLKRQQTVSASRTSARSGWGDNQNRDALIRDELSKRTERINICRKLDEQGIPTPPGWQKKAGPGWLAAWSNLDTRPYVQTLFSKVACRQKLSTR